MLSLQEQMLAKVLVQNRVILQNNMAQVVRVVEQQRATGNKIHLGQFLLQHNHVSQQNLKRAYEVVQQLQLRQSGSSPSNSSTPFTNSAHDTTSSTTTRGTSSSEDPLGAFPETNVPSLQAKQNQKLDTFNQSQLSNTMQEKKSFGNYVIEEELGRGGMGVVFKAVDSRLGRTVALKIILGNNIDDMKAKRFLEEAKATARLKHPNIVDLYEINTTPMNYFTMEFIDGKPFSEWITKGLKLKDTLRIIHACAQAIHFAHKNGIIHRDIKPANIMLDKQKNPKVMDFGLAKNLDNNEQLSREGDILGTPAYMSPEQADGINVDAKSDVYSLGATMYQALVGRAPFQGESYLHVLRQVHLDDPIRPRNLNPGIPLDVEAICLKCLEKKPEKRYRTAQELAQDIENFLYNKPVKAKPLSKGVQFYKVIVRNKVIASGIILCIAFIASFLIFSEIKKQQLDKINQSLKEKNKEIEKEKKEVEIARDQARKSQTEAMIAKKEAENARDEAENAKNEAMNEFETATLTSYRTNILLADQFIKSDYFDKAGEALNKCPKKLRNWEWYLLHSLTDTSSFFSKILEKYKNAKSISVHKNFLACANNNEILIFDLQKKQEVVTLSVSTSDSYFPINRCVFSPRGNFLAAISEMGQTTVWSCSNWKVLYSFEKRPDNSARSCVFTRDEKILIVCFTVPNNGRDEENLTEENRKNIILYNLENGQISLSIQANRGDHDNNINDIYLSVDEKMIIAAGDIVKINNEEFCMSLWDINTGKRIDIIREEKNIFHSKPLSRIVNDPNKRFFITIAEDYSFIVWNYQNYKPIIQFTSESLYTDGNFSHDGKYFAIANKSGTIIIFEVGTWRKLASLSGYKNKIESISFSSDDKMLICAGAKGVKIWRINFNNPSIVNENPILLPKQNSIVTDVKVSRDKTKIAIAVEYGAKFYVWNLQQILDDPQDIPIPIDFLSTYLPLRQVAFSPSGKMIASTTDFSVPILWDVDTKKKLASYVGHSINTEMTCCSFDSSGERFATSGEDGSTRIWSSGQGKIDTTPIFVLYHQDGKDRREVYCNAFHPNGKYMITAGEDALYLWNIDESKYEKEKNIKPSPLISKRKPHKAEILSCAYSEDGKYIVSSDKEGVIVLWDSETLTPKAICGKHEKAVETCKFIPGFPDRIISGSKDGTIRIWDISGIKKQNSLELIELLLLPGHLGTKALSFSPDGKILLTGGEDKQIRLWHITNED